MDNLDKDFTGSTQDTYRHGHEIGATCDDCSVFSGWFYGLAERDRWERAHRCSQMIQRNQAQVVALVAQPVITQEEFLELELAYLFAQLKVGNQLSVAVSIATINQQLHYLGLGLTVDPEDICARVVTSNGVYRRWAYLDAVSA